MVGPTAFILALGLDSLVTVEWSYPYCMDSSDGPAHPAVGFPLPYAVASPVSSLEFDFTPHVLVLNLLLLSALFWPVARLLKRAISDHVVLRRIAIGLLIVLGVGILGIRGMALTFGDAVVSFGNGAYLAYGDLRPVGITSFDLVFSKRQCRPSEFWFGGR